MQIAIEEKKKTEKERLLNRVNASKPKIEDRLAFFLFFTGVLGKQKLKTPNNREATAAIRKVHTELSRPIKPINSPDAIHPSVPKARINGNSLPPSLI